MINRDSFATMLMGNRASLHSFQEEKDMDKILAVSSTVKSYLGIEKREGLASIGEKLVKSKYTSYKYRHWLTFFRYSDRGYEC